MKRKLFALEHFYNLLTLGFFLPNWWKKLKKLTFLQSSGIWIYIDYMIF